MTERKLCLRKLGLGALAIAAIAMALAAAGLHAQAGTNANSAKHAQTGAAQAESAPAQLPAFDVASIKPHKSEGMMMQFGISLRPDGLSISGVPLAMLLQEAFGVPDDRILNEPAWVKSDRYDIEAKVDPDDAPKLKELTTKERFAMLVPLFEERFGLKFHHEIKDLEVYDLVVARGGSKLEAAKQDKAGGKQSMGRTSIRTSTQGMTIEAHGIKAGGIAGMIATQLGSTVVDRTGLAGTYDYTFKFAPEMGRGMMMTLPPPPPPMGGNAAPPAESGPSIFSAVQEQLGLKLEAHKEPVDVIVIDHIGQPSAN